MTICPTCNIAMQEVSKTGVLIDVCPTCRGVWLDRGELEKVLSRAREVEQEWESDRPPERRRRDDDYDDDDRRYRSDGGYQKKRRWTEIFDIFD